MVCNHCTMDRRGMLMYPTCNGYVCQICRDEIACANGEVPDDDWLHDAGAAEKCGFANVAVSPHDLRALLNTIAELRRAEAEAYERAAKVCEDQGTVYAADFGNKHFGPMSDACIDCAKRVRALTKQQDTAPDDRHV